MPLNNRKFKFQLFDALKFRLNVPPQVLTKTKLNSGQDKQRIFKDETKKTLHQKLSFEAAVFNPQ